MRRRRAGNDELRAATAAKLRQFSEEWLGRLGADGGAGARAEAIERGERVTVAGHEIPPEFRRALGVDGSAPYVLAPDGSLRRWTPQQEGGSP